MPKEQQPEALAEFAQTARSADPKGEKKSLDADQHTKPIPTPNAAKHEAAADILKKGAEGEQDEVDVETEVEDLPDRIADSK